MIMSRSFREGKRVRVHGLSGKSYEYIWTATPSSGAMKDVYFAPDKSYVVAYYKERQNARAIERLENLVGAYREKIFNQVGGEYWTRVYCWPIDLVQESDGRIALIVPAYHKEFFFLYDGKISTKGCEKEGKWFTAPNQHFGLLNPKEIGDWRCYFNICLHLARGVRRMHAAGLAHSDLSYKNVLIDPVSQSAAIIDIDGFVVPGKFPPDVVGTPDFIAPEVYATMHLQKNDPNRKLPSQTTDRHALAVLIYEYLLYRHPLRGKKVWDIDDERRDEALSMGEKAIFIEHPSNRCNRYDAQWVKNDRPKSQWPYLFPWMDLDKLPYTILGPYLGELVERAFITGLHNPSARPSAMDWEDALVRTLDLMQPCSNPNCKQKWFVFDNKTRPRCPFCGTVYTNPLPVVNLYRESRGSFRPENWRIMVYNGTRLYPWHVDPHVAQNEKLTEDQKKPVACFQFHQGTWYLRNLRASGMIDCSDGAGKKAVQMGEFIPLKDGTKVLLDGADSRLIVVQMVNGK